MALGRLELLKSADFLNSTAADTTRDTNLKALLIAATARISDYCARALESASYTTERYTGKGEPWLYLQQWPVTAITSVAIWDNDSTWQTVTAAHYTLRDSMWLEYPALGYESAALYSCWPAGYDIRITYTAGYTTTNWDTALVSAAALGTVPADLEWACCALAANLYRRRGDTGISSEALGPRQITYASPTEMPAEIAAVLTPYKRVRL